MVELDDGTAGRRQKGEERQQSGLPPDRVGPSRPQHGECSEGQHQPGGHAEQALRPVPGRQRGHRRGRAALHHAGDHPAGGAAGRRGVQLGRRCAPGRCADGRRKRGHEGRGQQWIARWVGEGLDRCGHPEVAVGECRGHRGEGGGVAARRGPGAGDDDPDVAGRGGDQQHEGDHPSSRRTSLVGGDTWMTGIVLVAPPRGLPHRPPPRLGSDGSPYRRGGHPAGSLCQASRRGGAVHITADRTCGTARRP